MNVQASHQQLRTCLLRWFGKNARHLPWRKTDDPYAIWVSEVMLQQTQVETAKPYYERFLRRFPTVKKLAKARFDSVLKLWEGLGYYGRARNLHLAAQKIVSDFAGRIPQDKHALLTLPGIGQYTAGAISSIAFGRAEPVVDGNVTRVLCRVFRLHGNPQSAGVKRKLWSLATDLVPPSKPGIFNQALMELGSTVCVRGKPKCDICPLARICGAKRHGEQEILPARAPTKRLPRYTVAVGIIYNKGKVLIDKRKPTGLLGGLWEFPGGKKRKRESLKAALKREVREELGIDVSVERPLMAVEHAYSHFRVRLHVFECRHVAGRPRCHSCQAAKWVQPSQLRRYAFPAANKKIIEGLKIRGRSARRHRR